MLLCQFCTHMSQRSSHILRTVGHLPPAHKINVIFFGHLTVCSFKSFLALASENDRVDVV